LARRGAEPDDGERFPLIATNIGCALTAVRMLRIAVIE
jgi:hypothetical protein